MKKIILLIALSLAHLVSPAQSKEEKIDGILANVFTKDGPGGVALVTKGNKVIYRKAFGHADIEQDVEMDPGSIFRIGSITKQFTSVAILQLVEEGKIDLQDDIRKYIEDYPTHGHNITIEHLLTHTSGIKSLTGMESWTSAERKIKHTPKELIDVFKNQPMDFAPGTEFKYNNSGYVLLGNIIEKVSGMTYQEYVEEKFFKPLDMERSYYGSSSRIIMGRANGYEEKDSTIVNTEYLSMTNPFSAGGLLSTVDDLDTWYRAIMDDRLISKGSREMAHKNHQLKDGRKTGYGYGWSIGNIFGSPIIEHTGGINGFLTSSVFMEEEDVFIAIFSNCNCIGSGFAPFDIAALMIDRSYDLEPIMLSEEELGMYEGVYSNDIDVDIYFFVEEGNLYGGIKGNMRAKFKMTPYDKDRFFATTRGSTMTFKSDGNGTITGVTWDNVRNHIERRKTTEQPPIQAKKE